MLLPEEFKRCPKCGQGWFEKKEFVLIYKGSKSYEMPDIYKKEIQYHCVGCGHIEHKYNEQL
jgi:predicted nucleic-acid-binding Zn-ribbon protein